MRSLTLVGHIKLDYFFYMAIFGHIKNLFTLSPVMKRPIRPFFSLPTQKHFMVKIECQIEKWKYLFESHILPYQPNKTLHAHPILLSCYSHNVFTSACYVWTIIWGDCASWMKHFAKCSLNTPLQKKCLSHNLTNKLCAFFLCERI